MAQLVVRQLEDRVTRALKERARRSGRSAEEEHRQILKEALDDTQSFKEALAAIPNVGDDELFVRPESNPPSRAREIEW